MGFTIPVAKNEDGHWAVLTGELDGWETVDIHADNWTAILSWSNLANAQICRRPQDGGPMIALAAPGEFEMPEGRYGRILDNAARSALLDAEPLNLREWHQFVVQAALETAVKYEMPAGVVRYIYRQILKLARETVGYREGW